MYTVTVNKNYILCDIIFGQKYTRIHVYYVLLDIVINS